MKHHIIVKWNEKVLDKKAIVKEVENIFNKALEIDGINKIEYIENVIDRPNRYDLMIRIDMDENVLPIYDKSAPHKEWKDKYSSYIECKAIFDSK